MRRFLCFQALGLAAATGLLACAPLPPAAMTPSPVQSLNGSSLPTAGPVSVAQGMGMVTLTIRWPERPDYAAQAIPLRTNALVIRITDAAGKIAAESTVMRPNGGNLVTTANLNVPAGAGQRIDVKAYTEQTPGFDSVPIAQGSTLNVTIVPSIQQSVRVVLVPTAGPVITGIPANAGPLSYVTIEGSNFDGWGGEIKVFFNGIPSPFVSGSGTQLVAQVPSNAVSGPISVEADGVTGTSTDSCRIIRTLALSPDAATTSTGLPLDFVASAQDDASADIPAPAVEWSYMSLGPAPLPGSTPPPPTTLTNGRFTPGSTGSYEIRISAGSVVATASVTVE